MASTDLLKNLDPEDFLLCSQMTRPAHWPTRKTQLTVCWTRLTSCALQWPGGRQATMLIAAHVTKWSCRPSHFALRSSLLYDRFCSSPATECDLLLNIIFALKNKKEWEKKERRTNLGIGHLVFGDAASNQIQIVPFDEFKNPRMLLLKCFPCWYGVIIDVTFSLSLNIRFLVPDYCNGYGS